MKFKAVADNILIRREKKEEERTKGGLFIPKSAGPVPSTAEVIETGPDVLSVKKDDVVFVGEFSGTRVVINGEELVVIKEQDVLGIAG